MTESNILFSCNSKEITFLCSLIGANSIFGLKDPFLGLSDESIKNEWIDVSDQLVKKSFIDKNDDGSIIIDKTISAVLSTCCFCDTCIMTNHTSISNESVSNYYYNTDYLSVLMTVSSGEHELYSFYAFENSEAAQSKIISDLMVDGIDQVVGNGGTIVEESFLKIKNMLKSNEPDKALSLLKDSGFEECDADKLINSLLFTQFSKVILVLKFKDNSKGSSSGFAILKGESGLWKLSTEIGENGNIISITPCNSEQLKNDLVIETNEILNTTISTK